VSDRRRNIEILLKTLKVAYAELALLKADLADVEAKNRRNAERVRLDRKLNNETVKRRNKLDSAHPNDVKETAPKRPVGRDASGLPSIGTGRAARQKIAEELREARTGEKPAKPEGKGLKVVKAEKKPKKIAKAGVGGAYQTEDRGAVHSKGNDAIIAGAKAAGKLVGSLFGGGNDAATAINTAGSKTSAGGGNAEQQADAGKARTGQ